MPSPFPGMNPYLEHAGLCFDFNLTFHVKLSETLHKQLPAGCFPLISAHDLPHADRRRYIGLRNNLREQPFTVTEILRWDVKQPGRIRDHYLKQRTTWLDSGISLVEIDLLRGGERTPLPGVPDGDYRVVIGRGIESGSKFEVWPVRLRDRLPVIPIPLRPGGAEIALDLQQVLHDVYDSAHYGDHVYHYSPDVPLSPDDAAWAAQFVPAR
jgi:hypothetical protein